MSTGAVGSELGIVERGDDVCDSFSVGVGGEGIGDAGRSVHGIGVLAVGVWLILFPVT